MAIFDCRCSLTSRDAWIDFRNEAEKDALNEQEEKRADRNEQVEKRAVRNAQEERIVQIEGETAALAAVENPVLNEAARYVSMKRNDWRWHSDRIASAHDRPRDSLTASGRRRKRRRRGVGASGPTMDHAESPNPEAS